MRLALPPPPPPLASALGPSPRTRLACAVVPLFPLAARLRAEPELANEAVVVLAGGGPAARVVAATRAARKAGIRPGVSLSQARARLPKLVARSRDGECERAAQEALLDVAESFSPRVEDGGEGLVYLDVVGLEKIHRGESPEADVARALQREVERTAGLPARVGVASSKLAARLAALAKSAPSVVAPGGEAAFLAPLPMAQLLPAGEALATLERWGIRSAGELAALPPPEVASRLGPTGQELQALARGLDPRPLVPRRPPPSFREGMELEWPLVSLEPFLFVARAALDRLVKRMETHGFACARLEVTLELEPDGRWERAIALPAPTREVKTLLTLVRLDLEAHPPEAPTIAFTIAAHPDRPRESQLSLFGPAALAPDRLATTLARLFAVLGDDRTGSPRPADGHPPERFSLVPFAPPPPPPTRRAPPSGRGLLAVRALRPPIPLEVMTDAMVAAEARPDEIAEPAVPWDPPAAARPVAVRSLAGEGDKRPRVQGAVRLASGPWGLEEGWWDEPTSREYWDLELAGGALYRVYRDRATGEWFADGLYG